MSVATIRRAAAIPLAAVLAAATAWAPALAASDDQAAMLTDAKGNPVTALTAATFADPPMWDWPWVRWNFPPETAEIAQLEQELVDLQAAGVGGVEIGQGGVPTFEQLAAILEKATELGMKVSIKYKDGAPVPGTYAEDDDYVRKMVNVSDILVPAGETYEGALGGEGTIVAVLAYQANGSPVEETEEDETIGIIELEPSSMVDLTSTITGTNTDGFFGGSTAGEIAWTAPADPADATWALITVRAISYSPQPEVYSREGTDQLIAGYEAYWTDEIKDLLVANEGGDIFVDSHDTDPWGAVLDMWSSNFEEEFATRVGYDLIPVLPALIHPTMNRVIRGNAAFPVDHYYTFADGTDERIRSDFNQLRSDLFVENRIIPFQDWAHGYGLALRLQYEDGVMDPAVAYNFADQIQVVYHLDRTEHETLAQVDAIDSYRPMASANHLSGSTWYSNELAAALFMNTLQTFQDLAVRMSKGFAGGNTKPVYHVYPYYYSPEAVWPGHDHFGVAGFSAGNGPRNPNWASDATTLNDWMSRNGQVLKQGVAKADLAVYMQNYSYPSALEDRIGHWNDAALYEAGYSWDYLNPTLLSLEDTIVTDGRLAAEGPAYKALVFNANLWPPENTAHGDLTIPMAERFLEYAEAGLPIIFAGELPSETPGFAPEEDAQLQALVEQLVAMENVLHVETEAEVPAALAELGIAPAMDPAGPSTLFSVRRYDPATDTDYYFLYNQGNQENWYRVIYEEPETAHETSTQTPFVGTGDPVDLDVTFEASGAPYLLDTDSGAITPIAGYVSDDGHVTLPVSLARDETMIVAFSGTPARFDVEPAGVHVVSTSADSAVQTADGGVAIRASAPGSFEAELSDGTVAAVEIDAVPEAMDLTAATWQLSAEDWQPAEPYGTTGAEGAATAKEAVELELDGLTSWPDIPELESASGVGTYTTVVELPETWDDTYGAYLDLGQVVDSFTLTVNGTDIPIDQLSATADVGPFLQAGENEIVVRVSTTLNNRLTTLDEGVMERGVVQEYGLVGPVVLTPYRQMSVWEG